jgi:ribosomal protein L37AE/L43A
MKPSTRGAVYFCPVCHAEIMVLAPRAGDFRPRCCNKDMVLAARRIGFYVCSVCGSELGVLRKGPGLFQPHCCNKLMLPEAA